MTLAYAEAVTRFRALLEEVLPAGSTVLVVSKGDSELLRLEGRRAWHFPQRSDGVYAGYHPPDSAAAVAHLEALREKGAAYLAIPPASRWWLDHYVAFAEHLERHHQVLVRDEVAGHVYALGGMERLSLDRDPVGLLATAGQGPPEARDPAGRHGFAAAVPPVEDGWIEDAQTLFDLAYYGEQVEHPFSSAGEALEHYLRTGGAGGASPHRLFDREWYLRRHPSVRSSGADPFLHFVRQGVHTDHDPNPYFDTAYYYAQRPHLREEGVNALVHYLRHGGKDGGCSPNPLFHDAFYARTCADVHESDLTPLEHYLRHGCEQGHFVSAVHRSMAASLSQSSRDALTRGRWRSGMVLFFTDGTGESGEDVLELARHLAEAHHLDSTVVARERSPSMRDWSATKLLVLDDFGIACDFSRLSALRQLAKTFTAARPMLGVVDSTELFEALADADVPAYFLLRGDQGLPAAADLARVFERTVRAFLPSTATFAKCGRVLGRHPTNVALRHPVGTAASTAGFAERLLAFAGRDLGLELPEATTGRRRGTATARELVIPCSDWNVSGVNAALEAIGRGLLELGWDVRILFTRDRQAVVESAQGEDNLPTLPHGYLARQRPGIEGMWEALIAELETNAPGVVLMGYDFIANAVAPALTDRIGTAMWVQADDGDYYEQVYRLGRYCDRIVCVSDHIRDVVSSLNPALAERATVIHNSSVWDRDIVSRRPARKARIRIVYTGRLVQYQKRVLDFLPLARALDRAGVPYGIDLIGDFSPREGTKDAFLAEGAEHLADGRIVLRGRMSRERILETLEEQDFFVLLSDFEGLPLALVEAMARGCVPVAAQMDSGIPEVLTDDDNGLVMSTRDYDAWAARITQLWADKRRIARMSKRARATVRNRFTVELMARRFDEVLAGVAEAAAAGRPRRPPALTWGARSMTGDVIPAPNLVRPAALRLPGLG